MPAPGSPSNSKKSEIQKGWQTARAVRLGRDKVTAGPRLDLWRSGRATTAFYPVREAPQFAESLKTPT